jgi:formate C-acetyltransferase
VGLGSVPGREYGIMDIIKINLAAVLNVALRERMAAGGQDGVAELWECFQAHLRRAIAITAAGIDFQYRHMHEVFPELVLDLLSHGPLEKGVDASHGGVEFYTYGVDAAALATAADSMAAIEQQIEMRQQMTWADLREYLETNWAAPGGEQRRLAMKNIPRFGAGGTRADEWAQRIATFFAEAVREKPTPDGHMMLPGLFSWASAILLGQRLGATPNGRRAGEPISHGANPDPGFRQDGALTALAAAVAGVQPGYGNTAPLQLDLDPCTSKTPTGVANVESLIRGHFDLGGTQINANLLDKQQVLEAHRDPSRFPDLIVRVTGFSAYFASLSLDLWQLVVDRIIAAE